MARRAVRIRLQQHVAGEREQAGHLVETQVDACGCAGGPTTTTYEHYQNGMFQPTDPPGRNPPECSASWLATVAYTWEVQVLHFDHFACADGWALAVGTGTGFTGSVVGLFDRGWQPKKWELLTLDNGNALPAAPSVYDLPLPLLTQLADKLGSSARTPDRSGEADCRPSVQIRLRLAKPERHRQHCRHAMAGRRGAGFARPMTTPRPRSGR